MPDQGNFCSGLWGYLRCIGNGAVVTSELTEISKCLIVVMFAALHGSYRGFLSVL